MSCANQTRKQSLHLPSRKRFVRGVLSILEILKTGRLALTLLYLRAMFRDGYRGSQSNK